MNSFIPKIEYIKNYYMQEKSLSAVGLQEFGASYQDNFSPGNLIV